MSKKPDFTKEGNITVSASIGVETWNQLRNLQKQGIEAAFWSNVMRRGARLIIDCAEGNDPYEKIERLTALLAEAKGTDLNTPMNTLTIK